MKLWMDWHWAGFSSRAEINLIANHSALSLPLIQRAELAEKAVEGDATGANGVGKTV